MTSDEIEAVRERIARVEYEFHHPPDKELAWDRIKDEARFAPLVAVYYGRADALLDALGLEQIGWWQHGTFRLDKYVHSEGEPLFRLAGLSDSREGSDEG